MGSQSSSYSPIRGGGSFASEMGMGGAVGQRRPVALSAASISSNGSGNTGGLGGGLGLGLSIREAALYADDYDPKDGRARTKAKAAAVQANSLQYQTTPTRDSSFASWSGTEDTRAGSRP